MVPRGDLAEDDMDQLLGLPIEAWEILAVPFLIAFLTAVVGNWLVARWNRRQKFLESAQTRADDFFRIYGNFFATWKIWDFALKNKEKYDSEALRIFESACSAEGQMESFLVKLCVEVKLNETEIDSLGRFRQGYQTLRQRIRDEKPLAWNSSKHPEYVSFKILSTDVAQLVSLTRDRRKTPSAAQATEQLTNVTANKWEVGWFDRSTKPSEH